MVHHEAADEDSRPSSGVVARGLACVLERLPAALQEQTLLRIEDRRLPGRDAEESVVECLGILGEYVGILMKEVKRRPVAIIQQQVGIDVTPLSTTLVLDAQDVRHSDRRN